MITPEMVRMGMKHLSENRKCGNCKVPMPPDDEGWMISWVVDTEKATMRSELICPGCLPDALGEVSLLRVH